MAKISHKKWMMIHYVGARLFFSSKIGQCLSNAFFLCLWCDGMCGELFQSVAVCERYGEDRAKF